MTQAEHKRADAVRNRERVIEAAKAVFAEHGIEAGIPEIAERAGVGKGTVYRNFDSKEDLVAAILIERLHWFEAAVEQALTEPDAWTAFRSVLVEGAVRQANDQTLGAGLDRPNQNPALRDRREHLDGRIAQLMAAAQKQGRMRRDLESFEVKLLYSGVCRALVVEGVRDEAVWRRSAELVVDAFRA